MNLNDLDVDTLTLILAALCRLSAEHRLALRPISLVSRRLRSVTIRWIFVTYKWSLDCLPPVMVRGRVSRSFPERIKTGLRRLLRARQSSTTQSNMDHHLKLIQRPEDSVLPPNLQPYVQHLILCDVRWPAHLESHHHQERLDVLIRVIPRMTSLRTVILRCTSPSEAIQDNINNILATFSTLPLLETVAFRKLPWDLIRAPPEFPSLRRLAVDFGPQNTPVNGRVEFPDPLFNQLLRMGGDPWGEAWLTASRASRASMSSDPTHATSFLLRQSNALQDLEIPAELVLFDALISVQWPALHSLVLTGKAPQGGGEIVRGILRSMSQLQILHLRFVRQNSADATFVLVPCENPPDLYLREILPKLQSFTLSNVSEREEVFTHLPSTITSLSLPLLGSYTACSRWIRGKSMQGIMDKVSGSGVRLVSLSLSLEKLPSPAFITHISEAFPDLQSLELHNSFDREFEEAGRHSWNSYMDVLSHFEHLRNLWIAIPSLHQPGSIFLPQEEGEDGMTRCAELLTTRLKGITTLALEYHVQPEWGGWNEWLAWDVLRDANNLPVLRYTDNAPADSFTTLGMPV